MHCVSKSTRHRRNSNMIANLKFLHHDDCGYTKLKLHLHNFFFPSALNHDQSALFDFKVSFDLDNELLLWFSLSPFFDLLFYLKDRQNGENKFICFLHCLFWGIALWKLFLKINCNCLCIFLFHFKFPSSWFPEL